MKLLLLIALLSSLSISCKQQTAASTTANQTPNFSNSCTVGKWSSGSLPINLKLSSEFVSDFTGGDIVNGLNPIEQMGKVWNDSISGNTFFTVPFQQASTTGYTSSNSFHDSEMGIYKSYNWFSDVSSSALAITQYYGYLRSNPTLGSYVDLTHADIIVNYRDFGGEFTTGATPSFMGYDISTVILHEMGHFLGLCHDSGHTSIMRPYYMSARRTLYSFDITKITDLYVNNLNTLGSVSAYSTANAISLPEGTLVRGRIELMAGGLCKHYLNGKLVFEHQTDKKGLVKNKAFNKIFSKFNKLF
jgi:hypothetical protein